VLESAPVTVQINRASKASTAAAQFVQLYLQRETQLGATTLVHPVPARAAQMISFQFGGPVEVRFGGDVTRKCETAALIGLQTQQRCQLLVRGNVETFVIAFRASAMHRLFGLPAAETTNQDNAAHAVLGAAASELTEQLGNARTFQERVQIADQFIIKQSFRAHASDAIERAANEIMLRQGGCRIDALVQHTGLSMRSFQRTFQQRIGVSPKLYARIIRFEAALKTKAASPHISWTTVAHQLGYYDHMHLVHDFKQLSGEAPTGILDHAQPVLAPQIASVWRHDPDLVAL
jgi:AraC-like DNA-binding protein